MKMSGAATSLIFSWIFFLCVIRVQSSSSYVYTYDHADDGDEQCCLVRVGEQFCLAKPLTRSLIQVKKDCQRLEADDKKKDYLKKIVRRLNVEQSDKVGEKILIQLKDPLDKTILSNDLLCLTTTTNNIDLEKCYVKLAKKEEKKPKKKPKKETSERERILGRILSIDFLGILEKVVEEEEEEKDEEEPSDEIPVTESVQIHQGRGLSVRQVYELNLTNFRAKTREQRTCWSWYREHTRKLLKYPNKLQKSCISLTNKHSKCLRTLFHGKSEESISSGSKLYCETNDEQTKLLGYLRRSEICFLTHYRIALEHHFTDFLSLSDRKKNHDVLQFISNNTKLTKEFEADCRDRETLDEIKKLLEEKQAAEEEAKSAENDEPISTEL